MRNRSQIDRIARALLAYSRMVGGRTVTEEEFAAWLEAEGLATVPGDDWPRETIEAWEGRMREATESATTAAV